jgi:hypothetical protein
MVSAARARYPTPSAPREHAPRSRIFRIRLGQCRAGKTHVLVRRVIRLLLARGAGENPSITFTRPAE